jgi:hypothetical protein
MSFVNKIKGWGQKGSAQQRDEDDAAFADAFSQSGGAASVAATDLPLADVEAAAAFDVPASVANEPRGAGSIISEAVPSEIACRAPIPGRHRSAPLFP